MTEKVSARSFQLTESEHNYIKQVAKLHRITQRDLLLKAVSMFLKHTPVTQPKVEVN